MADETEKLAVGRIVKAFGIKGEVVVEPLTDDPERFRKLRRAYLGGSPEKTTQVTVTVGPIEPRGIRLRIGGVEDRATAGRLAGKYLFVSPQERLRLPKGRYFVHEIVGLRVVDQEGTVCGIVREVHRIPPHDLYAVAKPGGGEFLLPAVRAFIREVDTAAGVLRVNLIEGLAEE
jgi:16S rRNA processing protein RimM